MKLIIEIDIPNNDPLAYAGKIGDALRYELGPDFMRRFGTNEPLRSGETGAVTTLKKQIGTWTIVGDADVALVWMGAIEPYHQCAVIAAIKLVREFSTMGLMEAKKFVQSNESATFHVPQERAAATIAAAQAYGYNMRLASTV